MSDDSFFVGMFLVALMIASMFWTYGCVEDYRAGACFDRTKNENCYDELRQNNTSDKPRVK